MGAGCLLLPRESRGLNPGCQAWQNAPLPTEPSFALHPSPHFNGKEHNSKVGVSVAGSTFAGPYNPYLCLVPCFNHPTRNPTRLSNISVLVALPALGISGTWTPVGIFAQPWQGSSTP